MRSKLGRAALAAFVIGIAGCATQPIYNVKGAPVMTASGNAASMRDVQQAIVSAGTALGWTITPVKPGHLTGTLDQRPHQAVVDITHDSRQYSIVYKASVALDAAEGRIHRSYNGWVQHLDSGIRKQLARL